MAIAAERDRALAEFVPIYLERRAVKVRPRPIATLRDRTRHALAAFGNVPLRDLERMRSGVACWRATLPEQAGHRIAQRHWPPQPDGLLLSR